MLSFSAGYLYDYACTQNIHTRYMYTVNMWNTGDVKHFVLVKTNGNWGVWISHGRFSQHPVIDNYFMGKM